MNNADTRLLNAFVANKNYFHPEVITEKSYQEAREQIVQSFSEIEDLLAIYEFGKINNPGVSDLDLIFVFNDSLHNDDVAEIFSSIKLSQFVNNILCGSTLMVISRSDFSNIMIWDDLVLTRIYGDEIPINDVSDHDRSRTILQVMDWLPERILSISRQANNNDIPLIRFLGLLHSLNYTFKKLMSLRYIDGNNLHQYQDHINETAAVRNNVFKYEDSFMRIKLASLAASAVILGVNAMIISSKRLRDEELYVPDYSSISDNSISFMLGGDYGYSFCYSDEVPIYIKGLIDSKNNILPVPFEWGIHWKNYAEIEGVISNKIKKYFSGISHVDGGTSYSLQDHSRRRINHCNSMAEYLYSNKFDGGLYKFGWFF